MRRPLIIWVVVAQVLAIAVAGCARSSPPTAAKPGDPAAASSAKPDEKAATSTSGGAAAGSPAASTPAGGGSSAAAPAGPAAAAPGSGAATGSGSTAAGAGASAGSGAAVPGSGAPAVTAPSGLTAARQQLDRSGGVRPAQNSLVYFIDRAAPAPTLQPVEVLIVPTKGVARAALTQLIQGADHAQLDGGIPTGTRILGIGVANGLLTVNLSKEFYPGQQTAAWARDVTASLIQTLTVFNTVQWVSLLVEGKPAVLAGAAWSWAKSRQDALELRIEPVIRYQGN